MRVASRIPFGDRKTGEIELRKKYFFAFEGKRTEAIYFTGLFRKYQKLSETPFLFDVIIFARTKEHDGYSHPKKVLSLVSNVFQQNCLHEFGCTYRELIEGYISYMQSELNSRVKKLVFNKGQKIVSSLHFEINDVIDQSEAKKVLQRLEKYCEEELTITGGADNVRAVFLEIQRDDLIYDKDIDSICLIVDRDKNSFFDYQFDAVCEECSKEGYRLFVTNPCFEFFLLLHKTDGKEYSSEELRENKKEKGKTFVERMLESHVKEYKKERFSFNLFQDQIGTALKNAKHYASELQDIKTYPGTNLPELIEELFQRISE